MAGLAVLSEQITDLSKSQWEILQHLERAEQKEEILGHLKLLLINTEEEVERITSLAEEYPEYGLLLIRDLKNIVIIVCGGNIGNDTLKSVL